MIKKGAIEQSRKGDLVGEHIGFERIARITGYLTTTVDRWNHAKQRELADRQKHGV